MISFYNSRDLASKLGVNLARWKRWSREFLPPDPLGGLQSGYARQFNLDDAFTVYLGGHLVADLKLSLAHARRIVKDLYPWLCRNGFYLTPLHCIVDNDEGTRTKTRVFQIYIKGDGTAAPAYTIREILSDVRGTTDGKEAGRVLYLELPPVNGTGLRLDLYRDPLYVLNITGVQARFLARLG